jgi:hypothetical protein
LNTESHGVVGNTIYDPENDRRVNLIGDPKLTVNNPKWWGGEPIWKTARNQVILYWFNMGFF